LRSLAVNCLAEQASRLGILPPIVHEDAFDALETYDWPGNEEEMIRVLTNLVQNSPRESVTAEMVQHWIAGASPGLVGAPGLSLAEMERQLIEATFARCGGNREKTAQMLGIGLRTLSGKLRQYGYPPRGGPGSNRRRNDTATPCPETARKAA
jgi:DNA-binding NtrC family response regulator